MFPGIADVSAAARAGENRNALSTQLSTYLNGSVEVHMFFMVMGFRMLSVAACSLAVVVILVLALVVFLKYTFY